MAITVTSAAVAKSASMVRKLPSFGNSALSNTLRGTSAALMTNAARMSGATPQQAAVAGLNVLKSGGSSQPRSTTLPNPAAAPGILSQQTKPGADALNAGMNFLRLNPMSGGIMSVLDYSYPQIKHNVQMQVAQNNMIRGAQRIASDYNKDLFNLSWYEKLGFFRSPAETQIQDSLQRQTFFTTAQNEIRSEATLRDNTQTLIRETGVPFTIPSNLQSSDSGNLWDGVKTALPWVLLGIVGIFAVTRGGQQNG